MSQSDMSGIHIAKTPHSFSSTDDDDSVVSTASSSIDEELESTINEPQSLDLVSDPNSSSQKANTKPTCPKPVHYIINALSAVGTFGGLALIITGGMGITLDKPTANTMTNGAMLLSGGVLLTGSFLGGLYHMSGHAPAQ